ncbi:YceI family protein [Sulfurospirillum arcachonense]|uniref:YceI family protein n=1 Tax=Sulfurospirillum arcachonense TaxID=57666 RepID=UPI0004687B6D|nr:YceI family protein [Sulfurospirillum arcachonense]
MKLVKTSLVAILAAGTLFAGNYNLDVAHSSLGFKVKHMMVSNVKGTFDKFNGSFEYDEKAKKLVALKGTVDISSVNTANAKRDGHLKSADFFDVAKFPEMNFELTKVDGDTAYGKLTMHGITKEVKLDFENNGIVKDPWGNTRVGLALYGKINRKDFGLVYNSALEAGGVLIGDKVKLDIELEGILAK